MRSTILLALLAALLLVPATTAHAQSREDILRDCADDDILQGDYPASKMRDALNNQPAELEEYSKCRDVLSRAIAAKTAVSKDSSGGDSAGGGAAGGSTGGGGGGGSGSAPTDPGATATPQRTGKDPGVVTGPSSPQDWKAIDGAIEQGSEAVPVNGRPISPAAAVGRNGIPVSLIVVLALLGTAAIAATAPRIRRRVRTPLMSFRAHQRLKDHVR